jgi:hypothetical protein
MPAEARAKMIKLGQKELAKGITDPDSFTSTVEKLIEWGNNIVEDFEETRDAFSDGPGLDPWEESHGYKQVEWSNAVEELEQYRDDILEADEEDSPIEWESCADDLRVLWDDTANA